MRAAGFATACLAALLSVAPLGQEGATISGHVTDSSSAPIADYSVIVFATDRGKWTAASPFIRLVRPTPDGSFEVASLPPGEYWVAAVDRVDGDEVSGDWRTPESLQKLSYRARRVTLAERERHMTILRLVRQ